MKLEIINQSSVRVPREFLRWWTGELTVWLSRREKTSLRGRSLCLVFLDRGEARRLNKQYRGKDYATDVLSFEAVELGGLGELIFCPEVLRRQAAEHGLSQRFELGYMVIHGILHLLGHEHENDERQAAKMYVLQDAAFDFLCRKWQSRP